MRVTRKIWFLILIEVSTLSLSGSEQILSLDNSELQCGYFNARNSCVSPQNFTAVSWYNARSLCRSSYSSLTSKIDFNSSTYNNLINADVDLVWVGIHRRANFFVVESTFKLYREQALSLTKEHWSDRWDSNQPGSGDCVALNVSSGTLITQNCSTLLPFVCDLRTVPSSVSKTSSFSEKAWVCPKNWNLLYFLSDMNRKCMYSFKALPHKAAEKACFEQDARLATSSEYDALHSDNILASGVSAYWANKENYSSCVFKTILSLQQNSTSMPPENCSKPLPFICIKDLDNEDIKVWITPSSIKAFSSTSKCPNPDLLICKVEVNGHKVSSKDNKWIYQWYKDDIPISGKAYVFRISYFSDPMKRDPSITHIVTRQGSYHCEVRLSGSSIFHSSPKVNFFYSDISTYIVSINIPYKHKDLEYSHYDFKEVMQSFDRSLVSPLFSEVKSRYPTALWDFLNSSVLNGTHTGKILLYIYQNDPDILENEMTYNDLKEFLEKGTHFLPAIGATNISLSVKSADVCFSQEASEDTCAGSIQWPTSKQSSTVITDPMCLDAGKRLIPRRCQASNLHKAEWSPFNCSACYSFQQRVQDLEFLCSAGYTRLKNTNFCYKIQYDKMTWNEAFEICSESSSYMLSELYDDIDPHISFWISYKNSNGKLQNLGLKSTSSSIGNIVVDNILNTDTHCVGAVFDGDGYTLKLQNCSKKLSFVCIQNPFEPVSSVKFSNTWIKLRQQDTCYYFENNFYNWHKSKEMCQQMIPKANFLNGIQSLRNYRYLKMLMFQLFNSSECDSPSWWMNLKYGDYYFLKEAGPPYDEYVDWSPETNFNFDRGYGALTLFPRNKIQWSLAKVTTKYRFICEMPECDDNRPTEAYIEDRSVMVLDQLDKNYTSVLNNFVLKCIPSGWFVTKSIRWYKDDILLDDASDQFSFTDRYSKRDLDTALKLQGYYSCSVDQVYPRKPIFSSKVLLRLPGFHTFVVHIVSENIASYYHQDCINFMLSETSNTFQHGNILSSQIECFSSFFLSDTVISNSSFHLKNITCNETHIHLSIQLYINKDYGSEENMLRLIQSSGFSHVAKMCIANPLTVSVKGTVACYGEKSFLRNKILTWPTTALGETAVPEELCLTDNGTLVERRCMGDFNSGAVWSTLSINKCSDAKSNVTVKLHQLLQQDELDFGSKSSSLALLTSSPKTMLPGDVQITSEILNGLAKTDHVLFENLDPVIRTINNIIDLPREVLEESSNVSNEIFYSFEHIISVVDIDGNSIEAAAPNIAVSVHQMDYSQLNIPNCAVLTEWSRNLMTLYNVTVDDLNDSMNSSQAGIVLPASLVSEKMKNNSDRVTYIIHQNLNYVENINVVSAVIQASFKGMPVYDVYPPVKMFFKLNQGAQERNHSLLKCVFWDQRLNENYGGWSYKGCLINKPYGDLITCSCNHLTSFAIILELNPTPVLLVHKFALNIITLVGCSLSCFGLGMVILTFIVFRQWRKSVKNKAVFNLSACLICFLIIFMTGINQTQSKSVCLFIAVILHYLLLTSFAWMLVSAFIIYLNLVKVLGTYIPSLIQKAMIFAYGIPAIVVSTVLLYKYEMYYQENYCWLSEEAFYYAIAGPVLLMLMINFIIFGVILHSNTCGKSKVCLRTNQGYRKLMIARAKALFCTSVLLGLSWIFGFLAVGEAKIVFQYLFAITTTLQGFLLFLFFIVRQRDVRRMWLKFLFPSSISDKSSISYINSSMFSNRINTTQSDFSYGNVYNNIIFRVHSSSTPYA